MSAKNQSCKVGSLNAGNLLLTAVYLYVLVDLVRRGEWPWAALWLVAIPAFKWAYLRFFPHLSRWVGYGSVADQLPASTRAAPIEVTLYTLLGCPFCPIVHGRLEGLQQTMGFKLVKVDLTLRPQTAAERGIKSVPVVEAGGERLVGNATSEQLSRLIAGAPAAVPARTA